MPPLKLEITEKRLIFCEGPADAEFLKALLLERKITGYQVIHSRNGKTGFTALFSEIVAFKEFATLESIVLIRDSDDNFTKAFEEARKQVSAAQGANGKKGDYGAPKRPLEYARSKDHPAVAIVLLPWHNRKGALEALLLPALYEHDRATGEAIEDFIGKVPVGNLPETKSDKARVACFLGATCEEDPTCSVRYMWAKNPQLVQLLGSRHFDDLAAFLAAPVP